MIIEQIKDKRIDLTEFEYYFPSKSKEKIQNETERLLQEMFDKFNQ